MPLRRYTHTHRGTQLEVGLCLSPLLFYFDLRIKSWEVGVETAMSSRMAIKEEREREMGDGR